MMMVEPMRLLVVMPSPNNKAENKSTNINCRDGHTPNHLLPQQRIYTHYPDRTCNPEKVRPRQYLLSRSHLSEDGRTGIDKVYANQSEIFGQTPFHRPLLVFGINLMIAVNHHFLHLCLAVELEEIKTQLGTGIIIYHIARFP